MVNSVKKSEANKKTTIHSRNIFDNPGKKGVENYSELSLTPLKKSPGTLIDAKQFNHHKRSELFEEVHKTSNNRRSMQFQEPVHTYENLRNRRFTFSIAENAHKYANGYRNISRGQNVKFIYPLNSKIQSQEKRSLRGDPERTQIGTS